MSDNNDLAGNPFDGHLKLIDLEYEDTVKYKCQKGNFGCKWEVEVENYLLNDHKERCNFNMVQCYCGEAMLKGYLIKKHLKSECKYRHVDHSVSEVGLISEVDDKQKMICPRINLGCKWQGTRYEELHAKQCNYNDVVCFCGKAVQKQFLERHLLTEDCRLHFRLQPGATFMLKKDAVTKTYEDKGVQCDMILELIRKLEEENGELKESFRKSEEEKGKLKDLLFFYMGKEQN